MVPPIDHPLVGVVDELHGEYSRKTADAADTIQS